MQFGVSFKSILLVLSIKTKIISNNTFNLKENPHDWLGAEPANLQTDVRLESFVIQGQCSPGVGEVLLVWDHLALSPEE